MSSDIQLNDICEPSALVALCCCVHSVSLLLYLANDVDNVYIGFCAWGSFASRDSNKPLSRSLAPLVSDSPTDGNVAM